MEEGLAPGGGGPVPSRLPRPVAQEIDDFGEPRAQEAACVGVELLGFAAGASGAGHRRPSLARDGERTTPRRMQAVRD